MFLNEPEWKDLIWTTWRGKHVKRRTPKWVFVWYDHHWSNFFVLKFWWKKMKENGMCFKCNEYLFKEEEQGRGLYGCLLRPSQKDFSHFSTCLIEFTFLLRTKWSDAGSYGGGIVHGLASAGLFTNDSIMNFRVNPSAGQAIASEHSSVAPRGIIGLKVSSLEYSLRRWNM